MKKNYLPLLLLLGCTLSRPVSGPAYDRTNLRFTNPAGGDLVVAVTNARLHYWKRGPFDRYTQEVYAQMETHDGYLGGAIRREIFGREVWTFTVWRDRDALRRFVHSASHLNAMYMAREAIEVMRSVQFVHPSAKVLTWEVVAEKLRAVPFSELKKL